MSNFLYFLGADSKFLLNFLIAHSISKFGHGCVYYGILSNNFFPSYFIFYSKCRKVVCKNVVCRRYFNLMSVGLPLDVT